MWRRNWKLKPKSQAEILPCAMINLFSAFVWLFMVVGSLLLVFIFIVSIVDCCIMTFSGVSDIEMAITISIIIMVVVGAIIWRDLDRKKEQKV